MTKKDKRIGNAQTIGARDVQSNYFSTAYNDLGRLFLVLADGTIDHPNGRRAAVLAVRLCVWAFMQKPDFADTRGFFEETALMVNRYVYDNIYMGKSPCLSLTMAVFYGGVVNYFNVGSNKLLVFDGRGEKALDSKARMSGQRWDYACGEANTQRGCTIEVLSYGAFVSLHPAERISILKTKSRTLDKAHAFIKAVNLKNLNGQLNASVILVEDIK